MKVFLSVKKGIPLFLSLFFLGIILFIYAEISNKSNQTPLNFISKKANFVFKLNAKDLSKSAFYSMVFNSKDKNLLTAFEIYLEKRKKEKRKNFGIDFTSDMYIFGEKYQTGQSYVFLFNLSEPEYFKTNLTQYLSKNQIIKVVDNIGMIVTYFSNEKNVTQNLKNYAWQLTKQKHQSTSIPENASFFSADFDDFIVNKDIHIKKGQISSIVNEKNIEINGEFELFNPLSRPTKWTLKKNGFHFEMTLISTSVQDSIQKYLQKIGIHTPEITAVSLNYYGMEFQESDKGLMITPNFDLLLTFKESYTTNKIFKDFSTLEKRGYEKNQDQISANQIHYHIDSIDSRNLFIGINPNQITHKNHFTLFEISGDPTKLTSIQNGGIISSLIQVLPQFKASKDLFHSIDKIEMRAYYKRNHIQLKGNLIVKNDNYIYNELLKFYLQFKGEI